MVLSFLKKLLAKGNLFGKKTSSLPASLSTEALDANSSSMALYGKKHPGKLVVVGDESVFSRALIEYAVDMAHRLSYEIVALNTAPLSCETFKLFSSSRKQVCKEFQQMAEKNVIQFRKEVEKQGIPFSHVVKFCDTDQAIFELQKEIGEIDFIVSDAQTDNDFEISVDQEMPRCEVFVYAMN
ncbi:MAG: hypothetical protein PVI90_03020 [Desulfobacteraceae bacterium]|jgi:hypothetical protein